MKFYYRVTVTVNRVSEDDAEFMAEEIRLALEEAEPTSLTDENGRGKTVANYSVEKWGDFTE